MADQGIAKYIEEFTNLQKTEFGILDERPKESHGDPNTIPQYLIPDNISVHDIQSITEKKNFSYAHISGGYTNWILPIPVSVNYDSSYNWSSEDTSWQDMITGDVMNKVLLHAGNPFTASTEQRLANMGKEVGRGMVSKKTSTQAVKYGLQKDKVAYNPNKQLYFNEVDMRDFTFQFNLVPMSKSEAEDIKKGFLSLAYSAAPSYNSSNFFFNYPSMFGFKIKAHGTTLLELSNLAITQLSLDLAPDGQVTWHDDGFPTALQLTVQFKESIIPTRENLSKITLFGKSVTV